MAQRYICTEPAIGANFYQTYSPTPNLNGTPTYGGPDQVSQLGIFPGLAVAGSFNTRWMWVRTITGTPALAPNTLYSVVIGPQNAPPANMYRIIANATAVPGNLVDARVLVTLPISTAANQGVGLWAEISDAGPLNLTPLEVQADPDEEAPPPGNGEPPPGEIPSRHRPRQHTGGPLA